jgi:hypothetical protein
MMLVLAGLPDDLEPYVAYDPSKCGKNVAFRNLQKMWQKFQKCGNKCGIKNLFSILTEIQQIKLFESVVFFTGFGFV